MIEKAVTTLKDDTALVACLSNWGELCAIQRDYDESKSLLTRSIQIAQQIGTNELLANAYYLLANVITEQGFYEEAKQLLQKSQMLHEQLSDHRGMAKVFYGQARILVHQGQHLEAQTLCQRALALQKMDAYQVNGHLCWDDPLDSAQSDTIQILRLLSAIAFDQEEFEQARAYGEEAYTLAESLQDIGASATTLYRLSMICRRQRELSLAQSYAETSFSIFERMGDRKMQSAALYSLSLIKEDMKAYKTALQLGERSLALSEEVQDNFGSVHILAHIGDLYRQMGRIEQAKAAWRKALTLTESTHFPSISSVSNRLAKLNTSTEVNPSFVYQPADQTQQTEP